MRRQCYAELKIKYSGLYVAGANEGNHQQQQQQQQSNKTGKKKRQQTSVIRAPGRKGKVPKRLKQNAAATVSISRWKKFRIFWLRRPGLPSTPVLLSHQPKTTLSKDGSMDG